MYASQIMRSGKKAESRVFDSVKELIEHATSDSNRARDCFVVGAARSARASWIGRSFKPANWHGVHDAANVEWPEGLAVLENMSRELADADIPAPISRKRKPCYSESDGDEVDFDRLRTGQPFWRSTHRANISGPATVTCIIDIGGNASVDSMDLLWRGAAAIAMTDLLENAGYRVELWAAACTTQTYEDGTGCLVAACLKRPEDPVDRSTLINSVAGWFFRTVCFAEKGASHNGRKHRSSLGQHSDPTEADGLEITGVDDVQIIGHAFNRENAIMQVLEVFKNLHLRTGG